MINYLFKIVKINVMLRSTIIHTKGGGAIAVKSIKIDNRG